MGSRDGRVLGDEWTAVMGDGTDASLMDVFHADS